VIGSFLNVCIYRLPLEQSIVTPRSHCPSCKKTIPWYDNIPLVSYVLLGGRCRSCKAKISFNYFLVELLTAAVLVVLFATFKLTPLFFIYSFFACGLIVVTLVDFKHQIIPDEISIPGIIIGFILSVVYPKLHAAGSLVPSLVDSAMGILVGGGTLFLLGIAGEKIFKKEAMGFGDVKLLAMIGAFLGWKLVLITIFLSSILGTIVGIILKVTTKQEYIAYGPFLAMAAVLSIFWGNRIIQFILRGV